MKFFVIAIVLLSMSPVYAYTTARDTIPNSTLGWIQYYADHLNAGLDSLQGNFQTQIDNLKIRIDSLDQRVGTLETFFSLITQPLTLKWSGGDPDGDKVYYSVYFGTDSLDLPKIGVTTDTFYNPGRLNMATWYFWQIVADDSMKFANGTTHQPVAGPIWKFKTVDPGDYLNNRR